MRFVCDQDVDARVAAVLRQHGHEAWTVSVAGLAKAGDDDLTVYAHDRGAVLITHDVEFSQRRRRSVIGRHIYLRCNEWDGPEVVINHLADVVPVFERRPDAWVKLSMGVEPEWSFDWQ